MYTAFCSPETGILSKNALSDHFINCGKAVIKQHPKHIFSCPFSHLTAKRTATCFFPHLVYPGKHSEIRMGTKKEQIMPLSTDSTTVSSLVYFSIMGSVVSSLVAPAEAMQL